MGGGGEEVRIFLDPTDFPFVRLWTVSLWFICQRMYVPNDIASLQGMGRVQCPNPTTTTELVHFYGSSISSSDEGVGARGCELCEFDHWTRCNIKFRTWRLMGLDAD